MAGEGEHIYAIHVETRSCSKMLITPQMTCFGMKSILESGVKSGPNVQFK